MAEYRTDITVYGSKENIIRMLNAAIRNVGNGTISLIEEGDDVATSNDKFKIEAWPDIKKALELAGFKNVNSDWCQLNCWE